MADITNQKLGGSGTGLSYVNAQRAAGVIDIAKAVRDGYTSGSSIELVTYEEGTIINAFDAVITETLVLGTSNTVDIGTAKADPDEYVDAQSTTAVGRFGAYVSNTYPQVLTADTTFYLELNGSAVTSGKIAFTIEADRPAKYNVGIGSVRQYPN